MSDQDLKELIAQTFKAIAELRISQAKTDAKLDEIAKLLGGIENSQEDATEEFFHNSLSYTKALSGASYDNDENITDQELIKSICSRKANKGLEELWQSCMPTENEVAEEFFYNFLEEKKELAGVRYDNIDRNVSRFYNKIKDEFDVVMINGKDVAVIEVKYKARKSDIEKLATTKKENFNTLFPDYKEFNQDFAIASFSISDDLKEQALDAGVIVLQRKGKIVETFVKESK